MKTITSSRLITIALLIAGFISISSTVNASPISYHVTVDTASIAGTPGSLDFQFNPGPFSQAASLSVLNFVSDGTTNGVTIPVGDVTGSLASTLNFDNATVFNELFEQFMFGNTLSFDIQLFGPAIDSPDGVSTSGSTFAFSMFSDAAGTIPVLTTDTITGVAYRVDVNLDGTTTASSFLISGQPVPEPGSLALVALGATVGATVSWRNKSRKNS